MGPWGGLAVSPLCHAQGNRRRRQETGQDEGAWERMSENQRRAADLLTPRDLLWRSAAVTGLLSFAFFLLLATGG